MEFLDNLTSWVVPTTDTYKIFDDVTKTNIYTNDVTEANMQQDDKIDWRSIGGPDYLKNHPWSAYPYLLILGAATVLGTIGNLMVMLSFYVTPVLRNSKNVFTFNLAITDILVCAVANPFGILGKVYGKPYFLEHPWLCDFVSTVCLTACVCALFSIGGISFNRYMSICHPSLYSKIFGMKANIGLCGVFWVCGASMALPALFNWTNNIFDPKMLECIWNRLRSLSYTIFFSTCVVFTPVLIISYSYIAIFRHVRDSKRKVAAMDEKAGKTDKDKKKDQSLKLARSFLIIFLIFVGCWSPYALVVLIDWHDRFPHDGHMYVLMTAHLHAALNPLVHVTTNQHFRSSFRLLLARALCVNLKPPANNGTMVTMVSVTK